MNQEVEIQIKIKNPKEAEKQILKLGKYIKQKKQIDKYFTPKNNDYFKQDPIAEYLRIRCEEGKNSLEYHFLHFNENDEKMSTDEYEVKVDDPRLAEEILEKIGMIYKLTVTKNRKVFEISDFEVTLDHIKELGDFIEIEAKKDFGGVEKTKQACVDLFKKLNLDYEFVKKPGYPRMIYEKMIA
ncbi:MAG: class IV adenylate cyclase [Candidatus Berkelbacteria bacterium]|nr:class IV adenylate cyclase [Candidatus Berkelbacteria bacterium]